MPKDWKEERQAAEHMGIRSGAAVRLSVGGRPFVAKPVKTDKLISIIEENLPG
jgi:hypothetical protein